MVQRTFDCGEQGEVANELRRLLLECHPAVAAVDPMPTEISGDAAQGPRRARSWSWKDLRTGLAFLHRTDPELAVRVAESVGLYLLEEVTQGLRLSLRRTHEDLLTNLTLLNEISPALAMQAAERVGLKLRLLLLHLLQTPPASTGLHFSSENSPPHAAPSLDAVQASAGQWVVEPLIKLCLHEMFGARLNMSARELRALRDFGRAGEDDVGRNLALLTNQMLTCRREALEAELGGSDGG